MSDCLNDQMKTYIRVYYIFIQTNIHIKKVLSISYTYICAYENTDITLDTFFVMDERGEVPNPHRNISEAPLSWRGVPRGFRAAFN